MHDESSRFLDRVQKDAGLHERGRALSGVRAVFYAVFRPLESEAAGALAEALPPELESLWKPAYFQCLRDATDGPDARTTVDESLRRVQRLTPTVSTDEAGRLLEAVIRVLREELGEDRWEAVDRRLPGELRAPDASSATADGPGE